MTVLDPDIQKELKGVYLTLKFNSSIGNQILKNAECSTLINH